MERYKDFVRRNAGLVSLFETGLSSLTWLLPERFAEGELGIEALHTALGLLSTFHDSIAGGAPGAPPPSGADLAFALSALEQAQVLLELLATRSEERGRGSRYTPLAVLEAVKALVRLAAWRRSGARLLLHGGLGNLEGPPPEFPGCHAASRGRPQEVFGAFAAFRAKRCRPHQQQQHEQEEEEQQKQQQGVGSYGAGAGKSLSGSGSGSSSGELAALGRQAALGDFSVAAAEVLHILRPLAYCLALRRWGRSSWRPWLLSLSIDLASMRLGSAGASAAQGTAWFVGTRPADLGPSLLLLRCLQETRWAGEEQRELAARRLRLLVYLLRDPLFAAHTRRALERWVRATGRVPLVGWLSGRAAEILIGVQRYYTYTERMAAS